MLTIYVAWLFVTYFFASGFRNFPSLITWFSWTRFGRNLEKVWHKFRLNNYAKSHVPGLTSQELYRLKEPMQTIWLDNHLLDLRTLTFDVSRLGHMSGCMIVTVCGGFFVVLVP
jgi:hypothetical protein